MGCCDSKVEPDTDRATIRGCTDIFWLCIYILFWGFMVKIRAITYELILIVIVLGFDCGVFFRLWKPNAPSKWI